MGTIGFRVPPLSRKDIEKRARSIRKMLGLEQEPYFNIVHLLEWVLPLPEINEDFSFLPVGDDELGSNFALAYPDKDLILARESVYRNACNGMGRDRLVLAHETGHLFLHKGISPVYAKNNVDDLKPYESSEWQATVFGAELLAPCYLIRNWTAQQVAERCKISFDAAKMQLKYASKIALAINKR